MNILLVENDDTKIKQIEDVLWAELDQDDTDFLLAKTVNDAVVHLSKTRFDLVIVDLVLPQMGEGDEVDATAQWCELIENHLSGRTASWIVMTAHADVVQSARDSFARHDVAVVQFDESEAWRQVLSIKVRRSRCMRPLDFVIVCALPKERDGFAQSGCELGKFEVLHGLDCQHVKIGGHRGTIVVQPGPGMISAAIVATKALAAFRPRALAMSGICGGRKDETELGALIAPDLSWNYQSGKFVDGRLTPDLLQVSVPPSIRASLAQLSTKELSAELRAGLMHSELVGAPIQVQPMVSGSQVVADEAVLKIIGDQGRKVAGVDMEVASIYFVGHDFFDGGGIFFAAKTVVDLANEAKDNRYHEYGCALSARFVTTALSQFLSEGNYE